MQLYSLRRTDSGAPVRVVCAVVFVSFTFLWLYSFQADVLAYAQHVFSHGQTHYNRLVGAVLITLSLWLLQWGVSSLLRLRNRLYALTYYPSVVMLALLEAVSPSADGQLSVSLWWLLLLPLSALWIFATMGACELSRLDHRHFQPFFSRSMWENLFVLAAMLTGLTAVANTDAVFHYRARVETCHEHDYGYGRVAVLAAGVTGIALFILGILLFYMAIERMVLNFSDFSIPRPGMDTPTYLSRIERYGQATAAVRDYVLCGLLIDRRLDAFARALPRYYTVSDSLPLPRHYREALTLYTHSRTNPVLEYHDAVTDEDYADLQELEAQYSDPRERHIRVKEKYQGSYWYYYEYMK